MPTTQLYLNDRSGNLWSLNFTTFVTLGINTLPAGPANAGLAFENNNNYNLYLPGVYSGNALQMGVLTAGTGPPLTAPSGTPVSMPAGSFRPLQALYDGSGIIYVADYANFLTAWNTTGTNQFQQLSNYPFVCTGATGPIKNQGLALNPTGPLLLTCYQDNSGGDHLGVISSPGSSPSSIGYPLTTAYLTNSYTAIGYDALSGYTFITGNSPLGGCLTVLNSSYSPISGSPLNTTGIGTGANADARGIAVYPYSTGSSGITYIFVCNFAANTLSVYQYSAASGALTQVVAPLATGPSPNAVAYYQTSSTNAYVYVTLFNGISGGLCVFTFNPSTGGSWTQVSGSPFVPGAQFVNVVVGP